MPRLRLSRGALYESMIEVSFYQVDVCVCVEVSWELILPLQLQSTILC